MRGTLNGPYRKTENFRINQGNVQILNKLRTVKPKVGSYEEWNSHASKNNKLRKHVMVREMVKSKYVKDYLSKEQMNSYFEQKSLEMTLSPPRSVQDNLAEASFRFS
jgi:hypothetical protein